MTDAERYDKREVGMMRRVPLCSFTGFVAASILVAVPATASVPTITRVQLDAGEVNAPKRQNIVVGPASANRAIRIEGVRSSASSPENQNPKRTSTSTAIVTCGTIQVIEDPKHGEMIWLPSTDDQDVVVLVVVQPDSQTSEPTVGGPGVVFDWQYYPLMARFESNDAGTSSTNWLLWRERYCVNGDPQFRSWLVLLPAKAGEPLGSVFTKATTGTPNLRRLTGAWDYVQVPADASRPVPGTLTSQYACDDDPSRRNLYAHVTRAIAAGRAFGALPRGYPLPPPPPDTSNESASDPSADSD